MKILVLNCGSSSIKYALYNMDDKSVMTSGGAERVGLDNAFVKVKLANGEKKQIMHDIPEHTEGVKFIFSLLTDPEIGVIKDLKEIDAVGHRMVHGGEKFNKSVILTDEVLKAFEECSDLAPLHNPANLKGVNAVKELMPGLPQVGVFDTAFHQTMPAKAYMYAIPYDLYEKYGVRRYGFHGTSHRYVSARACEFLGIKAEGTKMITCHIGNGGSIAAVLDGKCIDTSMGLTPLEGLGVEFYSIIFRLVVRVSDATLMRLIRPTGSAFVGRIRCLRRIRHRLNSAKPMTPATGYTDGVGRRARGQLTHSPPLSLASLPANGPPADGRRLNRG